MSRATKLDPNLPARGDDLHLQDDDHLPGLLADLVADVLLHLDDGEGGQLIAVDHGVELSGQHGEAGAELAITEEQAVPGPEKKIVRNPPNLSSPLLAAALDRFVTQNLQNWLGDLLTLADLGQSSGTELVRHLFY